MTHDRISESGSLVRIPVAGLLAWILPGAGHFYVGQWKRGLIFLVAIGATFWSGVAIGAVRYTVDPHERTAWFMAQLCTGTHGLAACFWGESVRSHTPAPTASPSYRSSDTGVVYSGVAGLLNLLVIVNALVLADPSTRPAAPAGEPVRPRGRSPS